MASDNRQQMWESLRVPWPNPERSQFVKAAGLQWHIQHWACPEQPKILLLHGTGSSSHSWAQLAPLLAPNFDVLCIDLPGHGFTQNGSTHQASLDGMARSVSSLLNSLQIAPTLIAGHSAGAAIAIEMTLQGLVRPNCLASINGALVPLSSPASAVFSPLAKVLAKNPIAGRLFSWQAGRDGPVRQLLKATGSIVNQQMIDCYTQLVANPQHVRGALMMMANWDLLSFEKRLIELKTPLCLMACSADKTVSPRQSAQVHQRLSATSSLELIPNLGHLGHEENPALFASLLTGFFLKYPA